MVEDVEFAEVGTDVNSRDFQCHQCSVRFVPTRFPTVGTGASPVGITVCEPFGDFTVRLDAFGVGMDDVAQEFGIQRVAGGAVEFEQHVARLRAESRCPVFVLRTGPYSACQVGTQLGQRRIFR